MEGKSENILVEYDYNNITIIDPNKVVDENGKAKERFVRQEDLVMYANLECKVLPRTKLALGSSNNDAIQTISVATINFLKPGDNSFLNTDWTDEITGKGALKGEGVNQPSQTSVPPLPKKDEDWFIRQTIKSNGKTGAIDNGLLGIISIDIRQNTSFMSQITVRLVDIKGRALFEAGDNSPYAAFFNLPYPLFYLTLKGYYGKAVRLPIMLNKFAASFNSRTSNFDITLNFLTYKYTSLNEVTMGALLATPHMYESELSITPKKGGPSQFVSVKDTTVSKGRQKIKEVYSEYKTKGMIPDDFPEITLTQMQFSIENFVKNVLEGFTKQNMLPLSNIDLYLKQLVEFRKDVYLAPKLSWFEKFLDKDNFFILNNGGTRVYTWKAGIKPQDKETAKGELKGIILKYSNLLTKNTTLGDNGSYTINNKTKKASVPFKITYDVFPIEIKKEDINIKETYRQRKNIKEPKEEELKKFEMELIKTNTFLASDIQVDKGNIEQKIIYFKFEGGQSGSGPGTTITNAANKLIGSSNFFMDLTNEMEKDVKKYKQQIEEDLTTALSEILQSSNNGIGFVPNIRNVLAVVFANGEAFLRLLDDVHVAAWDKRDDKYRKDAIFNKQVASASADNLESGANENVPVYPWPQFIVETSGENGQEKYELRYPGEYAVQDITKGNLYDVWPEVEFVEEFLKGLTRREEKNTPPTPKSNEVTDINRISFTAIEFPVGNYVFSNKEEVKYFYEIYERLILSTYYSRLSRSKNSVSDTDKVANVIAESESQNILKSLSNDNPFLIKKLKEYGLNSSNFVTVLRHFSNQGVGQNWQNFIRGVFNTSYIKNYVANGGFEFIDVSILSNSASQPLITVQNEDSLIQYITGSTTSNEYEFTDTYPWIDKKWVKENLSNGNTILEPNLAFDTRKVLSYNKNKKIITSFLDTTSVLERRPITNFIYEGTVIAPTVNNIDLKTFYETRTFQSQLFTEGNVRYSNYENEFFTSNQTSSILNSPYFVNAIQEGILNFRNNVDNPFVSAAYLFINSLPLATLREKFKTYENNSQTDLDYIFACLTKFGAVHKVPYPWILKIGSVWHRYKKYVNSNVDILDNVWTNFESAKNFDPPASSSTRNYALIINGAPIDIVLQKNTIIGLEESTLINVGFYPQVINDFNVFYQGYQVFSGFTDSDIQDGLNSGVSVNYVSEAIIDEKEGFDFNNSKRDLRIIPWSITLESLNGQEVYIVPSHGAPINQTLNECFDIQSINDRLKLEVINNTSIYNGSVRMFWSAPNFGYFDNEKLVKPSPLEYMKKVLSTQAQQENFSINGSETGYSKISDIFSIFEKDILDKFETEFLKFSKSIYDYQPDNTLLTIPSESEKEYRNFQALMRNIMRVPKQTGTTGSEIVRKIGNEQIKNITSVLKAFMNYDVTFKYGDTNNFDKKLFYTFSSVDIVDPYTWDSYTTKTPNALPGGQSLSQSKTNFPEEWKALETYVGFSEIPELTYKNSGSYITDFFIDFNIAFTETNVKNFAPIIKIYATQKLLAKNNNSGNYDRQKFITGMTDYIIDSQDFLNKILNNLMLKIQLALPNVDSSSSTKIISKVQGEQPKLELYETFKALNDKWISGNDFKTKTLFEDVLLMDRASRNIGDKVLVDIFKLQNRLQNINPTSTMLTFIQSILSENHFVVMNIPAYVNFYNVQDAVKDPKPKTEGTTEFANTLFGTFMNVDYRESSTKLVCFFAGKPSEQLDLKKNVDYRYRNDAFDLRRASDNPLIESQIGKKDWDKSNKVVGFNIDIGPQNQSIFTDFSVSQQAGQATAESMAVVNQMANQAGNRGGSTQSTSLYNLYKNRSYTCSVSMMGCALIQPTMYFNLRHVPMFSGPYMILEVNHSIQIGSFTTSFTGIRQPTAALPKINEYLTSLRSNLLNSILSQQAEIKKAESQTNNTNTNNNVVNQKDNVNNAATNKPANTTSLNTENCKPANQYGDFTVGEPSKTTTNVKDMVSAIIAKTNNINLQKTIFAAMYIATGNGDQFQTNENNYGGVTIQKAWGGNLSGFFNNKLYYCSSSNVPYPNFKDLGSHIDFFVARWTNRIGSVDGTKESITKFLILNSEATILPDNVYTSYDKVQLSNYETNVQKALDKFAAQTGQVNPSVQPPTESPIKADITYTPTNPPIFQVAKFTIDPNIDGPRRIPFVDVKYTSTAECCDCSTEDEGALSELISSDGQSVTIELEDLLFLTNCNNVPKKESQGSYNFNIILTTLAVKSEGSTILDESRNRIDKTFNITFTV